MNNVIKFRFEINKSFKSSPTHPITVPRSLVDYAKLEKIGFDKGDFIIIFPKGERVKGRMNSGVSSYGPYYQIRINSKETIPRYLSKGDMVIIILLNERSGVTS